MLMFNEWTLIEARFQPEEEYSWAWHPFHGVQSERGYQAHHTIFKHHPELHKIPHFHEDEETEHDYDPPRGFVRVDRPGKAVHYSRYDQSKFGVRGSSDPADAKEVDSHIRRSYNVPAHFKMVLHDHPKWWNSTEHADFAKHAHAA